MQQDHHELERREKESRLTMARMQRRLKEAESSLNRSLESEASLKGTVATLQQSLKRKSQEVRRTGLCCRLGCCCSSSGW